MQAAVCPPSKGEPDQAAPQRSYARRHGKGRHGTPPHPQRRPRKEILRCAPAMDDRPLRFSHVFVEAFSAGANRSLMASVAADVRVIVAMIASACLAARTATRLVDLTGHRWPS